jgi:hypothetical protein
LVPSGKKPLFMMTDVVTAWLDWKLKGAKRAKAYFTGPACGLCNDPRLTLERKNL